MKQLFRRLLQLFASCGVTEEEFRSVEPEIRRSNFRAWKRMHLLLTVLSAGLLVGCLFSRSVAMNRIWYLILFVYSVTASILFYFVLKPESLAVRHTIAVSEVLVLIFSMMLGLSRTGLMAVTFEVVLVVLPMFVIERPYRLSVLLIASSAAYLVASSRVKMGDPLMGDIVNTVFFCIMGIIVGVFYNDIRVRDLLYRRTIETQRDTDSLTGLMSRSAITGKITGFVQDSSDDALLFIIDVDHFKHINDTYGHDCGDVILRDVAGEIRKCFGAEGFCGRFGGDEFIVLLPGTRSIGYAGQKGRELLAAVHENVHTPTEGEKIGLSIGATVRDSADRNYDTLFKKADTALYRSKTDGRDRCTIFRAATGEQK